MLMASPVCRTKRESHSLQAHWPKNASCIIILLEVNFDAPFLTFIDLLDIQDLSAFVPFPVFPAAVSPGGAEPLVVVWPLLGPLFSASHQPAATEEMLVSPPTPSSLASPLL